MRVVVAEKPSVARDLARVLGATQRRNGYLEGNGLRITWCFGHMCELEEPGHYDAAWKRWSLDALPMLPNPFALRIRKGAHDQFAIIRRLVNEKDVTGLVNACDAGREGELIFRYVVQMIGSEKPVQRLWVSSLTDVAIKAGWRKLRPGQEYDNLADAARSRSEADWLVGLNATRALTCASRDAGGGALLSLGRVQTPTLAMIVKRDALIDAFVPEAFWRVQGTFLAEHLAEDPKSWQAWWFRGADKEPRKKKDDDDAPNAERLGQEDADAVRKAVAEQPARVVKAERKRVVEKPPLLYDLTALQRRANQRYGLSAQRTLAVAQALYEKHKLITYPRTDARFLTPDQVPGLVDVVKGIQPVGPYAPFCAKILSAPINPGKRVVNAAEVGDHHALLPTGRTPGRGLDNDEKRVFDLVARRLLAVLSDDALFDATALITEVDVTVQLAEGDVSPQRFRARGRVCRQAGWRAVDPPGKQKERTFPAVEVGDLAVVTGSEVAEGVTRPPRPHNDASILRAMELAGKELDDRDLARAMRSAGLGTPATRAAVLQTLLDRQYLLRDKKALRATPKGKTLIGAVPVAELKSAELTGRWEGLLSEMAEGRHTRDDFLRDVSEHVRRIIDAIRETPPPPVAGEDREQGPELGACPACEKPVRARGPVWSCDTGRSCSFVVFQTMSKRKISERMVKQLLKDGRSSAVKGFKSKKGNGFEAGLVWDTETKRVGFWFPERKPEVKSGPEGQPCPRCTQGRIIRGRTAFGCNRWREGCEHRIPF